MTMTQEDKELLLKDLCARLPYGVIVHFAGYSGREDCKLNSQHLSSTYCIEYLRMRPYLRPMSSMTEEERNEYEDFIIHRKHINAQGQEWDIDCFSFNNSPRLIDWLNAHHLDYRGLIEKGLALEASNGMYEEE